jgi:hypothetical protein
MKILKNILTPNKPAKGMPSGPSGNTQMVDRQKFPCLDIPEGVPIEAEFMTQDQILWVTRCIDISSEGAQIECPKNSYPKVDEGEKALLLLRLAGEQVQLPAIVMSREKNRFSLFLPIDVIAQNQEQEGTFFRILLTLDRAIRRRKAP